MPHVRGLVGDVAHRPDPGVDGVLARTDGFAEPFPLPYTTHIWWGSTPS